MDEPHHSGACKPQPFHNTTGHTNQVSCGVTDTLKPLSSAHILPACLVWFSIFLCHSVLHFSLTVSKEGRVTLFCPNWWCWTPCKGTLITKKKREPHYQYHSCILHFCPILALDQTYPMSILCSNASAVRENTVSLPPCMNLWGANADYRLPIIWQTDFAFKIKSCPALSHTSKWLWK